MVQGQSRTSRISPPIKEDEAKGDNVEKGQGNNLNDISSSHFFHEALNIFQWVFMKCYIMRKVLTSLKIE